MCGIAGIITQPNRAIPDLPDRLAAMAQAMAHRGPDDEGFYLTPDGRVGLASRRLAIRDLSPSGHMPMANAAGTVQIIYNGEIYNADSLRPELEAAGYTFQSTSDTEVILHGYEAWGEAVVTRLRGMFAFAILDRRPAGPNPQGVIFLARDHLGIKPLYYAQTSDALIFASELKALHAAGLVSREVSPAGLVGYLHLGSVPNPLTIYRDIEALEPANCLTINLGQPIKAQPRSYWRLPTDTVPALPYDQAVAQVRELLEEAIRIRLVSDVPLGAFLSGGLDSSTVVALMRRATNGPIHTCSMVFEEVAYSEASYAQAVAQAVGSTHYERVITVNDLAGEWDHIFESMDQPSVDGVNTYFVSQTARQAGLTVALSGLGGDELFGGYPNTFQQAPKILNALRLVQAIPGGAAAARAGLQLLPNRHQWSRVADALRQPVSPASAYLTRRGLFSTTEIQTLVSPDIWREAQKTFDPIHHIADRANQPTNQLTNQPANYSHFSWTSRAELRTYTHHQLLRDTDIMSMAHSLEVRVPLLDRRLVETVLRLPETIKTNHVPEPKPLLSQAIGSDLPELVRRRQDKQGFTFPFALWLTSDPLRPQIQSATRAIQSSQLLQPQATLNTLHRFQSGHLHWSRLWALLALNCIQA
ncbi:MAG: asparagine synthase (glutamine-hydrolyzing) [Anaerolineae bacterium]|nr:asparagine synthase (glutamine-hydrolyzing) [Anaerolineae bacterium]